MRRPSLPTFGRFLPVAEGRKRPKADIRDYQTDALKLALIFSAFFLPFKPPRTPQMKATVENKQAHCHPDWEVRHPLLSSDLLTQG